MRKTKRDKGITLIALIIIVVIVIVAVVVMTNKNESEVLGDIKKTLTKNELEEIKIIKKYILGKKESGIVITNIAQMDRNYEKGGFIIYR